MAWYDTGTVNVTNGSTTVVGAGTNFIAGAQVGEGFYGPDNRLYEIQAIVSATSLTLADVYLGANQTGETYKIVPTQSLVAALATQVSTLISDFQGVVDEAGSGKFDDGTAASAGITFTLDQDTGIFRPAANQIGFTTAGVQRALISNTGVDVTGTVTADGLTLGDNDKAIFGAGSDLQIYHDGSHSQIKDAGTGNLYIKATSGVLIQDNDTGTNRLTTSAAGPVYVYHAGDLKLATTSTGIDVTGTVTADSLGIGTADPAQMLDLSSNNTLGTALNVLRFTDKDGSAAADQPAGRIEFYTSDLTSAGVNSFITGVSGTGGNGQLIFGTGNADAATESMRIDDSGNVLVGKTVTNDATSGCEQNPNGYQFLTRDSGTALYVRRNTNDGSFIDFRKDTVLVGSIGSNGGSPYFTTTDGGFRIAGNGALQPATSTGSVSDGFEDLGSSGARWKDLFLSGGVVFGTGGPAPIASNTLDDYEEGTWTPTVSGSTAGTTLLGSSGDYTKVGNTIVLRGTVQWSATTLWVVGDYIDITMPFNSSVPNTGSAFSTRTWSGSSAQWGAVTAGVTLRVMCVRADNCRQTDATAFTVTLKV